MPTVEPIQELDDLTAAIEAITKDHDPRLVLAAAMRTAARSIERIDDGRPLNWVMDSLLMLAELVGVEIGTRETKVEVVEE